MGLFLGGFQIFDCYVDIQCLLIVRFRNIFFFCYWIVFILLFSYDDFIIQVLGSIKINDLMLLFLVFNFCYLFVLNIIE